MVFRSGNKRKIIPSWFWILLVGIPLSILIRWLILWLFFPLDQRASRDDTNPPRAESIPVQLLKDDFSLLKGIGPKTAEVFYSAGIFTFEQLSLMNSDGFDQLLRDNSLPATNRVYWQKQAALAANQDGDGLRKLQK